MPSRRHKRQTGPMYRATKPPGLSDHPCVVLYDYNTDVTRWELYTPALRRTAPVVRNRRHITDETDGEPGRLQRTKRGVPSRPRPFHLHLNSAHTGVSCLARRAFRRHLGRERSPFTRALE